MALLVPGLALAQAPSTAPSSYRCEVILAADDVGAGEGAWKFEVQAKGASHGGDGQTFTFGSHTIDATADGHWLTLSWSKNGAVVAQGLFVMSPDDFASHRVAILYNPDGKGEQVSLGCSAN